MTPEIAKEKKFDDTFFLQKNNNIQIVLISFEMQRYVIWIFGICFKEINDASNLCTRTTHTHTNAFIP